MDINEFLSNGVSVKNPNYKKPTKRNPSGSPRLIQSSNYDDAIDRETRVGTFLSENSYDLTGLNNDENKYAEYNVNLNPINTQEELNRQRAKNQSAWEQTGRFLGQAVGNEIVLGTALGLSNLVDFGANLGKEAGQDDYTNPFSTYLEGKQEEVRKRLEIYKENPNDSWQIGDFGWWADNAVSIASTLSMLIPSMAVTKGLGAVANATKLERLSMGIAKAAKAGNFTKGAYTLSKAINAGAEIGTAALLSRTMEGYLEARGVYKEVYDKSLGKLETMTIDDKAKLFKNNPEFIGKSNEEIAKNMSSLSADETFKNDYAMLLFDIAQFKALGSMWKGVTNKVSNSTLRVANRAAIASLADEGAATASKLGFFAKRAEIVQNALKNPMTSLTAIQLSEGVEEGYQGIQTEKGKEVAEKLLDPNFTPRTLDSYLTDGHIWEQAFWGVVGGMAFQAIGTGLGNASTAIKGKINKRNMTEQEYALSQMTDEKIREQEINSRKTRMQNFAESMQLINEGKNPFGYKLDPDTKQPILQEGSQVNEDITQDEADQLKTKLTNDFVTNMVLDATDKGNYDLFREYISNQNFNKFFEDAGLTTTAGDKSFTNMIVNKMDETYEQYNGALYDVMNSVDVENENVAKIVARSIARRKLDINDLTNTSDELAVDIANNSDSTDYSDYEESERIKYVQDRLNEIANKEDEIKQLLEDKRISPQAAEQISKENDIRRNQLLAFASTGNMFGNPEVVRNILSQSVDTANTDEFIAEFNRFLEETGINDPNREQTEPPKKSLQDVIKKKIELDDQISYLENTLPVTQSNYQSEYDDVARNVDRITVERYNKAADIVGEYLESQNDLDEARNNVMTNNVPANIKEQLDILKLGHHSTQRYTAQINALLTTISRDREVAAEEARNVTIDNNTSNDVIAETEILDIENVNNETDSRELDEASSSTGEELQSDMSDTTDIINDEQLNPNIPIVESFNIEDDIADLDNITNSIEQQRADDFILDNDSRAIGLASSITFNLFKTSRNLFDNLEGKDINSSEFNNIVNIVTEELFTQGVSRGYTRSAAIDGIKMALNMIYRRLNSKGVSNAETFKDLADQLATKHKIETITTTVNNNINNNPLSNNFNNNKYFFTDIGDTFNDYQAFGNIFSFGDNNIVDIHPTGYERAWTSREFHLSKLYDILNVPTIQEQKIGNVLKKPIIKIVNGKVEVQEKGEMYYGSTNPNNSSSTTIVSNSTTKLIPDSEFNQVVDQFIDSYIQNRGVYTLKGSKTIINVEDLFRELLNNKDVSYEQAKHIFFNISDYIRTPNNKYIFTNKTELNKNLKTPSTFFNNLVNNKSVIETISTYMHIAAPSKLEEGYNKAATEAINGETVNITYYEGEFGTSTNSISIKRNNVEIGYLGSVVPNSTNTGYSLKKQNQGFVYNLNNNNGLIESNLDKLFIPLINKENQQYSDLMDIAYKQFAYETAIKNNSVSSDISNEDVDKVIGSSIIKDIIANGDIKIPTFKVTNKQKAQYILNAINNIIFYDVNAITIPSILESYSYWKASTYNNYVNTHKLQQGLDTNKKINTKLVNIVSGKLLIDANNHDVNSIGFTYEQNPIMIVDANGNIINESNNISYSNAAGFEAGTMGMLITDNPNAPIIALFTESNKLSSNTELADRTYNEISTLFNNFQTKDISFDVLGNRLSDLFSGPGVKSNNLFSGYSVIKTSDKIAINIQGRKGEYSVIVHKFEKGTNIEGTGITHIPNGIKADSKSYITLNKKFNNNIAKEIVANLSFNKTFYAVNNKNVDNDKSNQYLYKENGKLIVNIGGKIDTYNNFGDFVLSNNAFKTNQGVNNEGGFFDVKDRVKSLYINTAIINSPVEELSLTASDSTASDIIKSGTKTESVNTSQILTLAGVASDKVAVLTGTNEFNIELIPKEAYFDNKTTKAEAYYSKGKMYFTNKGANAISKSPNNLIRLLIHENLHAKFEEKGLFQQSGIVDDLMNTYYSMITSINTSTSNKEVDTIKKWITDNKFNPTEYFTTLSVEQQRVWEKRSEEERIRQFAEEWLVESLTQPAIIRYLNNTIYNGSSISVEGIDNSAKTIWQKIIDVLLKLFSKGTGNIKNNTILAKQYSILGDTTDTNVESETNTEQQVEQQVNNNTPGETSIDDKVKQDAPVSTQENTTVNDISVTSFQTEGKKLDEQSDIDDLDFAVTNMIEDSNDNIKDGVDLIFTNNPELSNIGTKVQYSKYIDSIFPNTTIKNIAYHDTNIENKEFRNDAAGIFTTGQKNWWQPGKYKIPLLVNINSPRIIEGGINSDITRKEFSNNPNIDSIITTGLSKDITQGVYVLRNPEQVHILGNANDVQGFKNYINNSNNNIQTTDDIKINTYKDAPDINMNGVQVITDMNKYINQFEEQDKPMIAQMMSEGGIKFSCQ